MEIASSTSWSRVEGLHLFQSCEFHQPGEKISASMLISALSTLQQIFKILVGILNKTRAEALRSVIKLEEYKGQRRNNFRKQTNKQKTQSKIPKAQKSVSALISVNLHIYNYFRLCIGSHAKCCLKIWISLASNLIYIRGMAWYAVVGVCTEQYPSLLSHVDIKYWNLKVSIKCTRNIWFFL